MQRSFFLPRNAKISFFYFKLFKPNMVETVRIQGETGGSRDVNSVFF